MAAVVVLFGGSSGERRVSVASAQNVMATLPDAVPWFVDPSGAVFTQVDEALRTHARPFETDFVPESGQPTAATLAKALDAERDADVAFLLAFHGGDGENGTVQRELESRGLAFTGSGSAASARAFDKGVAKACVQARGVRVADAATIAPGDLEAAHAVLGAMQHAHGRVVAKPMADGSSVGLHHVQSAADVGNTAEAIAASGLTYLVETFVIGTELTVGVVDDGHEVRALCCSEVRLAPGRAFDFEGKYLGKGTTEITPAEVPGDVARAAMAVAVEAHRALGCEGYSRADVIATATGPVFLETNTLPGLTRASFIPQQLMHVGVPLETFLRRQIEIARARRATHRAP